MISREAQMRASQTDHLPDFTRGHSDLGAAECLSRGSHGWFTTRLVRLMFCDYQSLEVSDGVLG